MRTTVNLDEDVLQLAKTIAEGRGVSIGKVLSDLARQGATAQRPLRERNGVYLFSPDDAAQTFGPDDVEAALSDEDRRVSSQFVKPSR